MERKTKHTKRSAVPHKVLSDRGVHLVRSNRATENSNIHHGKTAFVWRNPNGEEVAVKVGQICPKCQKRVRGVNHEAGMHHKGITVKYGR